MRSIFSDRSVKGLLLALSLVLTGCGGGDGVARRVTIPSGSTFGAASDSLASAGLISIPRLFRIYATLTGRDRSIKAGTYQFEAGISWGEIMDALAAGKGIEQSVTIPEGYALAEIGTLLSRELGVASESVHAAARDSALRRRLNVPRSTLEGYLFPDTYRFSNGTSARDAVSEMVRRFEEVWERGWNDRLQELAMSRHDIITMASIIEKEVRHGEERPVISAVYHNRLRDRMPLQADPTVQYSLGAHRHRLLYRDLKVDSPYNTYMHAGLPPGPIASPGRASIVAALFPASVPYRYFVAHPDGHHEFSVTFKQHTEARRALRRLSR